MKVINYGSNYEIYENDLKTYDELPAYTYGVKFHPMMGFSLKRIDDYTVIEDKVYGSHEVKLDKVVSSYNIFERSLGVILSGDKGIGKSMFTQMLAERMINEGKPVIIVDTAYRGIANFIDSIDQEALILFDEFEKVFNPDNDNIEPQEALLGLFDGTSQKKRLYAITVNNLNRVNEYMINRTGRFHYHLRFGYPDASEVRAYLEDKVPTKFHNQIDNVIAFSRRIRLNFDCLRAIAFELSTGISFKEAIVDLNILDIENKRYDVTITFEGEHLAPIIVKGKFLDLFSDSQTFRTYVEHEDMDFTFDPRDLITNDDTMFVKGDLVSTDLPYLDSDEEHAYKDAVVKQMTIAQPVVNTYSYGSF